jgi:hypothetical protein
VEEKSRVRLLDLEQGLLTSTVVRRFVEKNSMEKLRECLMTFYAGVLSLYGLHLEDLYFEEIWLEKTEDFHIEVHFT